MIEAEPDARSRPVGAHHVLLAFLYIGCTAFGGPVAHRARFRELLVRDGSDEPGPGTLFRRIQLRPQLFEDLWVFANLLPGPSSSQVAIAIGRIHAGAPGAFAAWLGFTLPTALLALSGGYLVFEYRQALPQGLIAGLLIAVFVVILNAVRTMLLDHQKHLRPLVRGVLRMATTPGASSEARYILVRYFRDDGLHAVVAAVSCTLIVLAVQGHPVLASVLVHAAEAVSAGPPPRWTSQGLLQVYQFGVIFLGLAMGALFFPGGIAPGPQASERTPAMPLGYGWLILFLLLLAAAVLAWSPEPGFWLADLAARFYRVGSLVFGGGHVVLPLLEVEVVPTGLVERETFLIGYGGIQALPGPLFAFAAFLGTVATPEAGSAPGGWPGGLVAVIAIFAPSLLLVSGFLGVFLRHRDHRLVRKALNGANAAVVGILGATLWPIWTAASGKWESLGLSPPAFWLASLLLLALLVGIPVSASGSGSGPDSASSGRQESTRAWRLLLRTESASAGASRRVLRIPAPLIVIGAALGGWALGA